MALVTFNKSTLFVLCLIIVTFLFAGERVAAVDYTTAVPLPELATDTYNGQQGGLYPGGQNAPPAAYLAQLEAVDCAAGPVVVIGMSMAQNAYSGWSNYLGLPEVNDNLITVDGTLGSNQQRFTDPDYFGWTVGISRLPSGYTAADVKCIIYHNAISGPSGEFVAYAEMVRDSFAVTNDIIPQKYPNVELILINSRHYGYSPTSKQPEPYAYWDGFAVKWLIEQRINCTAACGPLVAWGTYQWDGAWANHPEYYQADGLHLSGAGKLASGAIWHSYYSTAFMAAWYLDGAQPTATPTLQATDIPTPSATPTEGPTVTPSLTPTATATCFYNHCTFAPLVEVGD